MLGLLLIHLPLHDSIVKKLFLLISIVFGLTLTSYAQTSMNTMNTRAKFKSVYILNFSKYTQWPDDYKQGDFVIGVVNDDDVAKNLEAAAKTKKVNSQNVVVKRFNSPEEVTKCHLIYIDGKSAGEVEPYASKAKEYKCLVVTEGAGLINGIAAINFISAAGAGLKYEMNRALFKSQDLVVSNSLENLATKVIN